MSTLIQNSPTIVSSHNPRIHQRRTLLLVLASFVVAVAWLMIDVHLSRAQSQQLQAYRAGSPPTGQMRLEPQRLYAANGRNISHAQ